MKVAEKCSKRSKTICESMNKYADTQYGSGRRIYRTETIILKTHKSSIGVGYKHGIKGLESKGVWFNYCPWCRGAL